MYNNNWKLLQDYIKKINLTNSDLKEKEIEKEKEFNSLVTLFYKSKKKLRILNDNNIYNLGLDNTIDENLIKKKIKVSSESSSLNYYILIQSYLLEFRDNFELLFKFISLLNKEEEKIISKFLVHFFFEDITKSDSSNKLNQFISQIIIKDSNNWDENLNDNFLNEDYFISLIFKEFLYRHEIKVYLNYIFKDLIKNLFFENQDKNYLTFKFSELFGIFKFERALKKGNTYNNLNNNIQKRGSMTINRENLLLINEDHIELKKIYKENLIILKNMTKFNSRNLKHLYNIESNEIKKHLIYKQLLLLTNINKKKAYNYFSNEEFINIIERTANKEYILPKYIKNMKNVNKFFIDFIAKLKKFSINTPNILKNTIKKIYFEISKKFPLKSEYEINSYVVYYFIHYLIIPFLEIPEKNEFFSSKIQLTSFNHNSLETIILLFEQISKGDFFNIETNLYYTNLNQIILNVSFEIHQFLLNIIKEEKGIFEYDFKNEEKEIYKTFCLSKKEIEIFLKKYEDLKKDLKSKSKYEQMIMNKELILSKNNIDNEYENYYVFIHKEYDKSKEQEIKIENKNEIIGETKTNFIEEIKICINNIFNNIPTLSQTTNSFYVEDLFNILDLKLNYHKKEYKNILISENLPLTWFSDYIIKNIKKLPDEYKNENYKNLFNEMYEEENKNLKILLNKKLIISTEFSSLIESLKKNILILKYDLKNCKICLFKTKVKDFIQNAEIKICLTNEIEKNEFLIGKQLNKENNSDKKITIKKIEQCIHGNDNIMKLAKNLGIGYKKITGHCFSVKDFINKMLEFKEDILNDIFNYESNFTKANDIIQLYIKYAEEILINDEKYKYYFISKNEEKKEEKINKFLSELKRYIIIEISNNLNVDKLNENNYLYNLKCRKYLWLKLEDFKIDKNKVSENQMKIALKYIKRMDNEYYYLDILKVFLKVINIIIKMLQFTSGKIDSSVEDFLPIIIYLIIQSKPEHLYFNLAFSKYFISSNDLNSMFGYALTNLETSINFINSITFKQFNIDKHLFHEKCFKSLQDSMSMDLGENHQ